jgi:hypothetical protein
MAVLHKFELDAMLAQIALALAQTKGTRPEAGVK